MVVNGKERICFLFCFALSIREMSIPPPYTSGQKMRDLYRWRIYQIAPHHGGGGNIYNFPPVTERGHDAWPRVHFLLGELGDDADERAVFVAQPLVVRLQLLQGLQIVEDKSALGEV